MSEAAADTGEEPDLHERAEAALGWIEEDATAVGATSPAWAEQACEELGAASATGKLLGRSPRSD